MNQCCFINKNNNVCNKNAINEYEQNDEIKYYCSNILKQLKN
jgi:hypothetical protein